MARATGERRPSENARAPLRNRDGESRRFTVDSSVEIESRLDSRFVLLGLVSCRLVAPCSRSSLFHIHLFCTLHLSRHVERERSAAGSPTAGTPRQEDIFRVKTSSSLPDEPRRWNRVELNGRERDVSECRQTNAGDRSIHYEPFISR